MAIALKSVTSAGASPAQATVTTSESPSATAVGDLVVVVNGNNFYALSNMGTPTATGSPTMNAITGAVADGGTNLAHLKGWWYVANTAGAQTISVTETGTHDEEKWLVAYVLSGAATTSPVDAAANSTGSSNSWVAPSVSPTTSDAFLIVAANSGGGAAGNPFTTPGGYTEDADFSVGASNMGVVAAHKQLAASGATGTITFTAFSSQPYGAVTITIKTAAPTDPGWGYLLLEDGTGAYELEGSTDNYLLDTAASPPGASASATLAGTNTLTVTGRQDIPSTATLAGTGTLAITGRQNVPAAATLTGAGTLAVTPVVQVRATATLAGTGTLAVSGRQDIPPSVTVAGAGTLAVTGRLTVPATLALAGAGGLAVTGLQQISATATLTGVGTLAVSGVTGTLAAATLTGVGTLAASGRQDITAAPSLTGTGTLAVAGRQDIPSAAALTGVGTLAVSGSVGIPVTITGVGSLAVTGRQNIPSTVTLAGTGTLAASPGGQQTASPTLVGVNTLGIAGRLDVPTGATLVGVGTLSPTGRVLVQALAALAGTGTLSATGRQTIPPGVSLAGYGALLAAVAQQFLASVTFVGVGTLAADGSAVGEDAAFPVDNPVLTLTSTNVRLDLDAGGHLVLDLAGAVLVLDVQTSLVVDHPTSPLTLRGLT